MIQAFISSRTTEPDIPALITQLRSTLADATIGVQHDPGGGYAIDKSTAWTAGQISSAQSVLDAVAANTPQRSAQEEIDAMPLATKALLLTLLDQINTIRAALSPPLGAITPAQALSAVRAKAGTL